jgi:DNA mismatch endonuclease (patch repair protein)
MANAGGKCRLLDGRVIVIISSWWGMEAGRMDFLRPKERSDLMSRVRATNTKPEIVVRRLLHALGIRFRLHRPDLPGRPDIVLPRKRKIIFVHGCFWHRHPRCHKATTPETRRDFWALKFSRNVERDKQQQRELKRMGWRVLVVWECETRNLERLRNRLSCEMEKD